MRVGCLQFASRPGEVETNMNKAYDILDKVGKQTSTAAESKLDFLVLPKLAFSGPDFDSEERGKHGPTAAVSAKLWTQTAAVKYNCTVVVGYPEVVDARCGQITDQRWFSCLIAMDKFGKTVKNDPERTINKNEAMFFDIKTDFGKITIGQCMLKRPHDFDEEKGLICWFSLRRSIVTDLGEREFSNDPETTAFAQHMLAVNSYAAIISMAWAKEDPDFSSKPPYKPDEYALSCWVARLEPLVQAKRKQETLIVLCNTTGPDTYAGTSAVLGIKDGEVLVYDYLGSSQEGLLVVDTSKYPVHKLSPRRMDPRPIEAGPNLEQDTESLASADSPQTGPLTPDTSYRGSDTAQEFPHEYNFDEEGAKRLALPAVRVFPTLVTVGRPATAKRQARPKLDIPKSASKTPREIPATEYMVRTAAVSDPKDSSAKVRSPEASTPYPGSRRMRLPDYGMLRRGNPQKFENPAPATPTTPFEDPRTAISMSPQCWNGPWSTLAQDGGSTGREVAFRSARNTIPMRPKTPLADRSRSPRSPDRTLASDPASAVVVDPRAIKRPVSPKSRNAQRLVSLKLPTDPYDCGIIPILASPSIMTTSPCTERSQSVGRGRRRKAREPSEEDSRSSSRDSTRLGLLHRRIRYSDGGIDVPCARNQRSQSSTPRPRNILRSASLPAPPNGRERDTKVAKTVKFAKSEPCSRTAPKGEGH
ncbi:asparagine amidohydrolase [Beauveria brongniartii RCEF 3172]|uniref:Asparagine amidohydrolase n=1 Tax=Beauveria brongniartii RCEF 3172 TaxID=1081107 RepID=A0A167D3W9_9HYPO|nr:asparagine amidohydrolase [Beauveria brongniartii RCEF 3172]